MHEHLQSLHAIYNGSFKVNFSRYNQGVSLQPTHTDLVPHTDCAHFTLPPKVSFLTFIFKSSFVNFHIQTLPLLYTLTPDPSLGLKDAILTYIRVFICRLSC